MSAPKELPKTLEQFSVGSENAINNITSEVVRDCTKLDIHIDEPVASLAVRLLCLDPANGLQMGEHYKRRDLEEFVARVVARFQDQSDPCIKALSMQSFNMEHTIDADRIIRAQELIMRQKTQKLTNEILTVQARTADDRERLSKKLAVDVIVNNCLGSPANQQLCIDINTALRSVMSLADLGAFMTAKRSARLDIVLQLRDVVCGIYVFNKDLGYCGEDIVDVGALVTGGHATTLSKLDINAGEVEHRTNLLGSVLAKFRDGLGRPLADAERPMSAATADVLRLLLNMLVLNRQHGVYVANLLRSLARVKLDIDQALKMFRAKLQTIREAVQFKMAIPIDQIFPHFVDLSQCWHRLQNYVYILTEINVVNERMMSLTDEVTPWENIAFDLQGDCPVESDADRMQLEDATTRIVSDNPEVTVCEHHSKLRLEMAGFCATSLGLGGGLLFPANVCIGICTYAGKHYAFRSAAAARPFIEHPKSCLFAIVEAARAHPDLIVLLDCFALVHAHRHDYHSVKGTPTAPPLKTREIDVQTELHPVASNMDKDYTSNVWDMRRKAIQFANLMRSRTHSAQTDVGYMRFGIETQTWSPRASCAQTMRSSATNVPRPLRSLRRTRGGDEKNSRTAQLTQFVEDDVHCSK